MRRYRFISFVSLGLACGFAMPATAAAQPLAGDAGAARYDGQVGAHIDARTPEDLERLESIGAALVSCELSPAGGDFILPPGTIAGAEALGFTITIVEPDVQGALDRESARIRASLDLYRQRGEGEGSFFDDYRPLPEVDAFIDELIARRPDLVSRFEIGQSHEGRPIWGMRISAAQDGCKPAFILNGLTHAREWLTVMNVLYLAEQLVDGYGVDPQVTDLVDRVEWLIIPVLNPDGYEYTWTTERFWRKNRREPPPSAPTRWGVDPNRNYSFRWGLAGSSGNPASQTYRGPAPFSEPETRALRDFVFATPQIRAHNDVHSYGHDILFPWSQLTEPSPDHDEYQALGDAMADLMVETHDVGRWSVGPLSTTLYRVSGGSTDWFYVEGGAMSLTYELRGGSFNPEASEILPGCRDTYEATLLHAAHVADRSSFRADMDNDCDFDFDDVLAFLVAFGAGEDAADFDADADHDIDDVLAFLAAFGEMS